jgi:hypothetical protein
MNYLLIKGQPYSTATYIIKEYKITADRLKKWREGRGMAKDHPLTYIELEGRVFLYLLNDIIILKRKHIDRYGDKPLIYRLDDND